MARASFGTVDQRPEDCIIKHFRLGPKQIRVAQWTSRIVENVQIRVILLGAAAQLFYTPSGFSTTLFSTLFFSPKASGMSSSPLSGYPHLPPTTNTLDSYQRSRLIRSTRKLGAVLGTTPYLLENNTSFVLLPLGRTTSKTLKRQGSIFTHNQSSSLSVTSSTSTSSSHDPSPSASSITLPCHIAPRAQSSEYLSLNPPGLPTTRRRRPGDKIPQLHLRINTVPVLLTDDRGAPPLPPTPSTPTPLTPITPSVPDVAETRRKRMAKLARHLGEHVPAELVFASESALKPATTSPNRRSRSVHVMPTGVAGFPDNRPNPARPRQDWVGEWNRSDIKTYRRNSGI
ncbi:hypothetical protein JVT61DRAFT_9237 [Boletus reticuloceps]|uniref:Uncharacterized protein n=1 Tax=Boletus reticuloceps TaxID=495285 RepID=A0A8I2YGG0_9AGAM|nr:hypothetical protein JVT61DRAFT_9237 [Boletus reticuloceps]